MTTAEGRHASRKAASWSAGLGVQARVTGALVIREAISRYGHENLGFFWVVAEPLMFTVGIMVLWSLAHISHGGEVDVIPFALTGYSFITLWRHITGRAMHAIRQHANLAYHRHVRKLDAVIAMAVLEFGGCFTAFLVAYVPLALLGYCPTLSDPLNLIVAYASTAAFSFGFGLMLAGLSGLSHAVAHVVPAFMYMTMPALGVFTMQEWMPTTTRYWLSWSPLVNGSEMFRSGVFPAEVQTYWSFSYLLISTVIMVVLGYVVFMFAEQQAEI